jgi:hypothetical protein
MRRRRYDQQLDALRALRAGDPTAEAELNRALADRNNSVVARAAATTASLRAEKLVEAASALAQSREPRAGELVEGFWARPLSAELRRALLLILRASPLRDKPWLPALEDPTRADEGDVRLR